MQTADEEVFADALHYMYFLNKHEIPHTTIFKDIKDLCMLLENTTMTRLRHAIYIKI